MVTLSEIVREHPKWREWMVGQSLDIQQLLWYEQYDMVMPLDSHQMLITGRGYGKSSRLVRTLRSAVNSRRYRSIGIVSPTPTHFKRELYPLIQQCFPPDECPELTGDSILRFPNGDVVRIYSGAKPQLIKGANLDLAFLDELAHYDYPVRAWEETTAALRVGKNPRWVVCTTPNNHDFAVIQLLRRMRELPNVRVTTGNITENPFISKQRIEELKQTFVPGSAAYREQFLGLLQETVEGAKFSEQDIDDNRHDIDLSDCTDIVMAIDPAISTAPDADETGMVVAAKNRENEYFILADYSGRMVADDVARCVIHAQLMYGINRLVVESNVNRELLKRLKSISEISAKVTGIRSTEKKIVRIEPVSILCKNGTLHFPTTPLADLEAQCCAYTGEPSKKSEDVLEHDDRVDAMAMAVTALSGRKVAFYAG